MTDLQEITSFLRSQVLNRLHIPEGELGNDTVLADLGMGSLDAVLISGKIEDRFEIDVDPTMMFEYRTINTCAVRIEELIREL